MSRPMTLTLVALASTACLTGFAARTRGQEAPAAQEEVQGLAEAGGALARLDRHAASGRFSIRGMDVNAEGADAAAGTVAFLDRHARVWVEEGVVPKVAFSVGREERDARGLVLHAVLSLDAVAVLDGRVHVRLDAAGTIRSLTSDLPAAMRVQGSFLLSAEAAGRKAAGHAAAAGSSGAAAAPSSVEKAWIPVGRTLTAGYVCTFPAADLVSSFLVAVDAETGDFILRRPLARTEQGGRP